MIKTVNAKMSDLSSMWIQLDKADNLGDKVKELLISKDVDSVTAPEAFLLYDASSNKMFKRDIFNLLNDKKIVIKFNPLVAIGMYLPYAPLVDKNTGSVQVIVNATSYCKEGDDNKISISVNDLIGLCQGAYSIYQSLTKYAKICSNFAMRKFLIELHNQVMLRGLSGSSIFNAAANARYLKYISARYLSVHHFGIDKDVNAFCLKIAGIENENELAFINQLLVDTPKEDWHSLNGIINTMVRAFPTLKGKVSIESMRQRVAIMLGSASIFALDYVPYLCALASGYYNNYSVYRSSLIKTELQPYCIAVCQNVLQDL